jgi:peptide/nickel transport system ATP-binding protein
LTAVTKSPHVRSWMGGWSSAGCTPEGEEPICQYDHEHHAPGDTADIGRSNDSSAANAPCLSVQDLRVWFELRRFGFGHAGYVKAVDGVNFDLAYGEAIGVVGESGCGKSSLMKTILGLKPAITEGRGSSRASDLREFTARQDLQPTAPGGLRAAGPLRRAAALYDVQRILEEPMIINGVKDKEERESASARCMKRSR